MTSKMKKTKQKLAYCAGKNIKTNQERFCKVNGDIHLHFTPTVMLVSFKVKTIFYLCMLCQMAPCMFLSLTDITFQILLQPHLWLGAGELFFSP